MIKIFLAVALMVFISCAMGLLIGEKLNVKSSNLIPIGFASYLFLLQMLYYPIQFFHLSSNLLMLVSSSVTVFLLFYGIKHIRSIITSFRISHVLWLIASTLLFSYIFHKVSISMELSDSPVYLNFIAQNIQIDQLNCFDFWTGKLQEPNEIFYVYQGYYHFGSFLCWLVNIPYYLFGASGYVENIAVASWGLGLIYSIVSSAFVLEVTDYVSIKSKAAKMSIVIFMLFYFNYFYWRIAYSFYGNTFRTLFIGMMMYYLYRKYSEKEEISIFMLPIVLGAGLASSSSYLFISFDVVYTVMAYFYVKKESNAFRNLSIIVFPIVCYVIGIVGCFSYLASFAILFIVCVYYISMNRNWLNRLIQVADRFLYQYGKYVLLIIIPLFLVVFSYILCRDPYYLSNYQHYFENHAEYDMFLDPYGIYANPIEQLYLIISWAGVAAIIYLKNKEKKQFMPFLLVVSFLIFLTPLTTPAIAKLYADFVYYRAFDILFNPFVAILSISCLLNVFNGSKVIQMLTQMSLVVSVLFMHLGLFTDYDKMTSYSYLLKEGESVHSIFKITKEDYLTMQTLRELDLIPEDHQITAITHAEGLKIFFPNVYQIFSRRQFFDGNARVNEEFYQIARRHYSWMDFEEIDYSKTCSYIKEYNVQLAIINYTENSEFDYATDGCMLTVEEVYNYKIKKLKPE